MHEGKHTALSTTTSTQGGEGGGQRRWYPQRRRRPPKSKQKNQVCGRRKTLLPHRESDSVVGRDGVSSAGDRSIPRRVATGKGWRDDDDKVLCRLVFLSLHHEHSTLIINSFSSNVTTTRMTRIIRTQRHWYPSLKNLWGVSHRRARSLYDNDKHDGIHPVGTDPGYAGGCDRERWWWRQRRYVVYDVSYLFCWKTIYEIFRNECPRTSNEYSIIIKY